ncbi:uncharacterized protein MELLADRAFT_89619 [Melampsora larici-populina 98AG31]|uniref:3-hydroxyacyl-CoA dehydrogenase NAD binding domain-containing protein n=1 Tax=Melampsora larici-populina (strain 98AG31 / pathotype 3-4-7) TaxID=747676 RepID=F4RU07_MELLP|nr:uncharacterized protein MELLADRAFT_89619 [Melampsora larici-populina 98AG31]EGG04095.1 hypothetical protein MELLADRAFT_89619 [Melampsora larici-populina 98AG31]
MKLAKVYETDLIVGVIIENLQSKQTLFETLDEVLNSNGMLTAHTSIIKLSESSKVISQEKQSQVAGLQSLKPFLQGQCAMQNRIQVLEHDVKFEIESETIGFEREFERKSEFQREVEFGCNTGCQCEIQMKTIQWSHLRSVELNFISTPATLTATFEYKDSTKLENHYVGIQLAYGIRIESKFECEIKM